MQHKLSPGCHIPVLRKQAFTKINFSTENLNLPGGFNTLSLKIVQIDNSFTKTSCAPVMNGGFSLSG